MDDAPELPADDVIVELSTPYIHPLLIREISWQMLVDLTSQDETLSEVLRPLKQGKPSKESRWKYSNDVNRYISLFKCFSAENSLSILNLPSVADKAHSKRICIPECLKKHVWLAAHTANGHFGCNKTSAENHRQFYLPNISSYVELQNRNHVTCFAKQKLFPKPSHVPTQAQLDAFNECLNVDMVGPLSPAGFYQGKRVHHILTIQDSWTRFLVAVPIPDVSTKIIAHAIIEHWIHHSVVQLRSILIMAWLCV